MRAQSDRQLPGRGPDPEQPCGGGAASPAHGSGPAAQLGWRAVSADRQPGEQAAPGQLRHEDVPPGGDGSAAGGAANGYPATVGVLFARE